MDKQLLKRSVESIEMPEDMKDRIIKNCRSGEAKPLFLPKRRLAYIPTAVTACICVLAVALAGVGILQVGGLREGDGDPTAPLAGQTNTDLSDGNTDTSQSNEPVVNEPVANVPQHNEKLTLDKLLEICSGDVSTLSWKDFEQYESEDIGSGLYILYYDIEGQYSLSIGGVPDEEPLYMYFSVIDEGEPIDIREGGLEEYIASHNANEPSVVKEPLTLEKLKEVLSNCAKVGWSDFEQFESTSYGSTPWYTEYDIEGKYTLTIVGDPRNAPDAVLFHVVGQYYSINLNKDMNSFEEYLNQSVFEGDMINFIPLQEDQINYFMNLGDGEPVYMTDEQLSEYYGIDVTAFGGIPSYMEAESYTHNDGKRCIWRKDDGSNITYDKNVFSYVNPDGTQCIEISLGRLMNHNDKLWDERKLWSRIDGRTVVIGKTEADHYVAEFFSADRQISILVSAYGGILPNELYNVISALVQQTEKLNYHYCGEDSGNDLNFIHADYSEDESDDMWWSLNGKGYPDEPYILLLDEDFTAMSDEELNEYYGVNIFPDMPAAVTMSKPNGVKGPGVYRQNGGTGEIYFDTNSFWYSGWTSNNIRIDVAKEELPYATDTILTLVANASSLSYINGHPVLLMYDDYGCEYAIFITASGKAGFRIAMADAGYGGVYTTDLIDIVSQLINQ